jgi:hypothetical protein
VSYNYAVGAIDESCNMGELSSILTVTTDAGGSNEEENVSTNMTCSASIDTVSRTVNGSWTEIVSLGQGTNNIHIKATNKFGLFSEVTRSVKIDTDEPTIESHNLRDLNPTYNKGITITGSVSEPATVYVYMNDEESPSYSGETDDNLDFQIDAMLSMSNVKTTGNEYSNNNSGSASVNAGFGFVNKVKLIAVDSNGMSSDPVEEEIEYLKCSRGHWFSVTLSEPTDMLTPRMIIEGVAQVNMNAEIEWNAGDYYNATITGVTVHMQDLNLEDKKKWDEDWVVPSIACTNKKDTNGMERTDAQDCYIQFKIHAQDPGVDDDEKNWTMYDKEENISNHRLGECPIGSFGCVKIPYKLEITFDTNANKGFSQISDPNQITCVESYTYIDKRIPPDFIPESFLKNMVVFLNNTINAIDQILEPLKTITLWTLYGCMALMGVDFLMNWQESYSCKFNQLATMATGDSFSIGVAQVGMCSEFYDDGEKRDYCEVCEGAIRERVQFERNMMQQICDRIFCPSALSFQKFYENSEKKLSKKVKTYNWDKPKTGEKSKNAFPELKGFDDNQYSYDCAVAAANIEVNDYLKEYVTKGASGGVMNSILSSGSDSTTQASGALSTSNNEDQNTGGTSMETAVAKVDCDDLHIPSAECCKASYLQRWDSACLVMDEFKESACIYAKFTKHPSWVGESKESGVQCNVLWNSAAGFCEPDGSASADLLKLNKFYIHPNCIEDYESFKEGKETKVVFRVMPVDESDPESDYIVEAGYVTSDLNLGSTTDIAEKGEPSVVNSQLNFIPFSSDEEKCPSDFTKFFDMEDDTVMREKAESEERDSDGLIGRHAGDSYNYDAFAEQLAKITCAKKPRVFVNDSDDWEARECDTASQMTRNGKYFEDVKDIHGDLAAKVGQANKDYVVDPVSSFARSIQCVCLPAIKAYLQKYRNIMAVVKNCFQTILVTGDGSAGICREAISVYVCDFLYDLIKCFAEKYSSNGGGESFSGSFGNFLGSMTDSVNNVNARISNRYSGDQLFNAIYGEGKVAHAVCMWAFTGTWDLDFAGMLEDEYAMPITSTGAIYPCERRFISYNQAGGGIASFAYNFGVLLVAGADITYEVNLKCSSDAFSCNPQEGYTNGRCDCYGVGDKTRATTIRGTLQNGDTLEDDFYEVLQDNVRYDAASFVWTYTDHNGKVVMDSANCTFNQVGGNPPAFCSFDLGTSSYSCSVSAGTETYAKFDGDPSPYHRDQDYFKVGDTMSFDVPITFKAPQETDCYDTYCAYTKFVTVEVRYNDQTICTSEVFAIDTEGQQTLSIDTCQLKSDHFKNQVSIIDNKGIKGSGFPQDIKITNRPTYTADRSVFLGMVDDSPWIMVSELSYVQASSGLDKDTKPSGAQTCTYDETAKSITCGSGSNQFSFGLETTPGDGNWIWAWAFDVDSATCDANTIYQFTATAKIHPARDSYGLYEYNPDMVYTYNNQKQERQISFDVKCSDASGTGDGDNPNACPDPMYDSWESQGNGLSGMTSCTCGSDVCSSQSKPYCYDNECHASHAEVKDCSTDRVTYNSNLDKVFGYSGLKAKCRCSGADSLCIRESSSSKFCIEGHCYGLPGCEYDEVAKENCICVPVPPGSGESLICQAGQEKCLKYEGKCVSAISPCINQNAKPESFNAYYGEDESYCKCASDTCSRDSKEWCNLDDECIKS